MATQPAHTDPALYYLCYRGEADSPAYRIVKATEKTIWLQERLRHGWSCEVLQKRVSAFPSFTRVEAPLVEAAEAASNTRRTRARTACDAALTLLNKLDANVRYERQRGHASDEDVAKFEALQAALEAAYEAHKA